MRPAILGAIASTGFGRYYADLVIYGANPGGLFAAMAARRLGLSAVVIHPRAHIGGMLTGGIYHTDIVTGYGKGTVKGLADEFYRRLAVVERKSQQRFMNGSSYGSSPTRVRNVLSQMLAEFGVYIITEERLVSVSKTDLRLTSIQTTGGVYEGATFIDATYEGDLMAIAGITTFIGREANATYTETSNGVVAIGSTVQFSDSVDPYITPGDAGSGLLPGISAAAMGSVGSASTEVQAFTYRLLMTTGSRKVTTPDPDVYDPLQYELLGREAAISGSGWTAFTDIFTTYGLNDGTKVDVNNGAVGMSLNYISPECTEYITATHERRLEIENNAKQYILGLLKFCRTDTRIPSACRTSCASYGFDSAEYEANGNFPTQLYVREGRRMVGDFVLKQSEVQFVNAHTDIIGQAYYEIDSHHARRILVAGKVKNEGRLAIAPYIGANIPMRVLFPKTTECENVMPTFGTSCSHVAFCSLRMEPLSMMFGEAAAHIAAWQKFTGKRVQSIPYATLLASLDYWKEKRGHGSLLSVDGTAAEGTVTSSGSWSTASEAPIGIKYIHQASTASGAYKRFAPTVTSPEIHHVYILWPMSYLNARSAAVPVKVVHEGGTFETTINQNVNQSDGDWQYIGSFWFELGSPSAHYVEIGTDGSGGSTVISAAKFIPASVSATP